MSKAEQLQMEIRGLPEPWAGELLALLATLRSGAPSSKSARDGEIRKLRGSWKGRLSSSSDFSARKDNEIRLEE